MSGSKSWLEGYIVMVQGLTSEHGRQLNGKRGVICGSDTCTGRILISFATGNSPDLPSDWKKIQPWNVRFRRIFAADSLRPHGLAGVVGSEIWSRVLSYNHIVTWLVATNVSPLLYTAAELAATVAPYDGSYMIEMLTACSAVWLRRTRVRALGLDMPTTPCFLANHLPLHLEHFVLRSQSPISLGRLTAFPHLLHLDITNAHPTHRAKLLECSLPRLSELRAGSPLSQIGCHQSEDLLDAIGALHQLTALDIGYLRTRSGIDRSFWEPLFAQRNLRALDFSMVMRWVDFDSPLEYITANLQLESLAIHGLSISNEVFKRFCETCPLRHLRLRDCSSNDRVRLLAPVYTACALQFADFAGSLTKLSNEEVVRLQSWLELRQPSHFMFTGFVEAGAVAAAQALITSYAQYDFRILVVKDRLETLDGNLDEDAEHLQQHGLTCWGAKRRFFDILMAVNGESPSTVTL